MNSMDELDEHHESLDITNPEKTTKKNKIQQKIIID